MSRKRSAQTSGARGKAKRAIREPSLRAKNLSDKTGDDEKTAFFVLRLSPRDRERLRRAAAREFLTASAWVRRAVMRALDAGKQDDEG